MPKLPLRHAFVENVVPKAVGGHHDIDAHAIAGFGGHDAALLLDAVVILEKLGGGGDEVLPFGGGPHGYAVEQPDA